MKTFLILDDNPDGRFMVSKTLLRKFPQAMIHECADCDVAAEFVKSSQPSLAIVHRSLDADHVEAIQKLRAINPDLIILALSGDPRKEAEVLNAGATKFLHYDKWLLIGHVVADLLTPQAGGR